MNRGSWQAMEATQGSDSDFNEAPIHESGKSNTAAYRRQQ